MTKHILHIDDEPPIFLRPFYDAVRIAGYRLNIARTGQSAGDYLTSDPIILDIYMPDESSIEANPTDGPEGIRIYRFIRRQAELENIPIVCLTVVGREDEILRQLENEERDKHGNTKLLTLLTKPSRPSELLKAIQDALKEKDS
jgi:CheY-like chemotaxis protein